GVGFAIAIALFCGTAAAKEFELRGADLRVVGETTWTGGGWGGYHPVRLEITNFGPGRDLEFRFLPHERGRGVPTVRRRVRVEQNATARLTLAVPLVGGRTSGRFDVLIDDAPVSSLRRDMTLSSPVEDGFPRPSLLIISADEVSVGGFETAVAAEARVSSDAYPMGHYMAGRMGYGELRFAFVDPGMLPASWIDYTAVDVVAVRFDTLAARRPDERTALLDWVATGGRLIVDQTGAAPDASDRLTALLSGATAFESSDGWQPANVAERRPLVLETDHAYEAGDASMIPNEGNPLSIARDVLPPEIGQAIETMERALDERPSGPVVQPTWPAEPAPFFVRRVGFGRIAVVPGDVFAASGADWSWLLRELGGPAITWPVRYGMASGRGDMEFINQPIPGVRGVPTAAFLTLITLFALVIGPVNYFVLWRRNQLSRLVVTVPALAAVTSVLLFGYAAVAHGFTTKGRVRSVTLLDPATNTATSISRIALFAGMAPSSGLRFSNETAVFPLYPFQEGFVDGEVDWTDTQALTGGWLKTRTRTQFVTVTRRDERGRLTVTPVAGGLRAVNGFEVPLTHLVVTGPDGTAYIANGVPAGGEAVLKPLTDEDWAAIRTLAIDRMPEPPDGLEPEDVAAGLWGGMPWRWYQRGWSPRFREGLLERHLARLIFQSPRGKVTPDEKEPTPSVSDETVRVDLAVVDDTLDPLARPHRFLAVTEENPGIDLGGLDVHERGSLHMLMGSW
ncbi:MAG: hypothetical protein WBC44_19390, partial [Planctomycetaceae bacterium]